MKVLYGSNPCLSQLLSLNNCVLILSINKCCFHIAICREIHGYFFLHYLIKLFLAFNIKSFKFASVNR